MRFLAVIGLIALIHSSCGIEPCGEYAGEADIHEPSEWKRYECYTSIRGDLDVNVTDGLTHFEMPFLEHVGGDLDILCNYDLERFDLNSLVYVTGDVEIQGNRVLPNFDGLSGLSYIGGSLKIGGGGCKFPNQELSDISGLGNVESVGGDFVVFENPKLPTCAAEELLAQLKYFIGVASITGNDGSATCD